MNHLCGIVKFSGNQCFLLLQTSCLLGKRSNVGFEYVVPPPQLGQFLLQTSPVFNN